MHVLAVCFDAGAVGGCDDDPEVADRRLFPAVAEEGDACTAEGPVGADGRRAPKAGVRVVQRRTGLQQGEGRNGEAVAVVARIECKSCRDLRVDLVWASEGDGQTHLK